MDFVLEIMFLVHIHETQKLPSFTPECCLSIAGVEVPHFCVLSTLLPVLGEWLLLMLYLEISLFKLPLGWAALCPQVAWVPSARLGGPVLHLSSVPVSLPVHMGVQVVPACAVRPEA